MNTYLSEALGSFVFFLVILSKGEPVMIAVGLLIGIMLAQIASPAHLNPAVTGMMWLKGAVRNDDAVKLVVAQLLAAAGALYVFNRLRVNDKVGNQ
jgi:glycerol uptake facilitator-like aquaporin